MPGAKGFKGSHVVPKWFTEPEFRVLGWQGAGALHEDLAGVDGLLNLGSPELPTVEVAFPYEDAEAERLERGLPCCANQG